MDIFSIHICVTPSYTCTLKSVWPAIRVSDIEIRGIIQLLEHLGITSVCCLSVSPVTVDFVRG